VAAAENFNESHKRRLLASARYADDLLSDIEAILNAAESKSLFPKYRPDVALHQARLIRAHSSRFRAHLGRSLSALGISHHETHLGALHSIRVTLMMLRITAEEMAPEHLRGYGELSEAAEAELRGLSSELEGLIGSLERALALGDNADLQVRLQRLVQTTNEAGLLRMLDRIITEDNLAEFRAQLLNLVEKMEAPTFEIAVFGRVSSGKSSLLNRVLDRAVLPVGVNPITAVPTRLIFSENPFLQVATLGRPTEQHPIGDLALYASEEQNPGNRLGVTKLVVGLPSPRLHDGLALVDTPGIGALATAGAAETQAYLPQCDMGIVLISAASPINDEDLNTIQALAQAGIPALPLLSKADLLEPADRAKAIQYTQKEILKNLGMHIDVHPVSTSLQEASLLAGWFQQHLDPLMAAHRDLARESVRRKAGVLRESVISAIRARLDGNAAVRCHSRKPIEEAERALRLAAGKIDEARRSASQITNDIRALGAHARQQIVEAVLDAWKEQHADFQPDQTMIRKVAGEVAAAAGMRLSGLLNGLACDLQSALIQAANALRDTSEPVDTNLEEHVRDMPRFEIALPEVRFAAPGIKWPRVIMRSHVARMLNGHLAGKIDDAFSAYSRGLNAWVFRVLDDLQQGFESSADAYRAQLVRCLESQSLNEEDLARMRRHLDELTAGPVDGCDR
jgi:GTP-binding protein EngB required for normal cell division